MKLSEYSSLDATAIADLIRSGEVGAAEVRDAATRAVTAMDEKLNAVVEGPWIDAPQSVVGDGPLAGVPFVFKDILCHAAGVPTRMGTRALRSGVTFDHDTELMSRFVAAGLVGIANTTTPELALSSATVSSLTGVTKNPWREGISPGGSSGGSAALVASGAVPLAHANDGGGSIRIPAARTGLVGLKPSRGRVPIGPDQQEVMSGNAVEFALTRSVRDAALLLDCVHGYAAGDRYAAIPPARPYVEELSGTTRKLRVALCTDDFSGVKVDSAVADSVSITARAIETLGHTVETVSLDLDWDELVEAFNTIWCFGTAATVAALAEVGEVPIDENSFEETTLLSYRQGLSLGPLDLAAAFAIMNSAGRYMGQFTSEWDILLTPTANRASLPVDHLEHPRSAETSIEWVRRVLSEYPICALYNITGAPAVSLPVGLTPDGLPLGLHLGGAMYGESDLIGLSAELEQVLPWRDRRPETHVSTLDSES